MAQRKVAPIIAWLLACGLVLSAGTAFGDARTEARAHFKRGMVAIADGRYDAGVVELKMAYESLPHPNVLYNIARAYVDMGNLGDAIIYYKKYLEGEPPDSDDVAPIVASLEARVRRQQAELLEIGRAGERAEGPSGDAGAPAAADQVTPPVELHAGAWPVARPSQPSSGPPAEAGGLKTEAVFEEKVVTASRALQSPLDAPNSTSIITEQDIRMSGITKLPELLRRLAGVDIMETTGAQTEVSLRGFNQRLSNKVLVLVDGRSVYVDLIGATLWGTLSIGVEDVERIEVVRGPGSALYGADAFNGVINVITKAPGEGGAGFNVGYGDGNATHGTVWASGREKETAYRLSAGYDAWPRWSAEIRAGRADVHLFAGEQQTAERTVRLDATLTRQLGTDVTVGLRGGFNYGSFELLAIGPINDHVLSPVQTSDLVVFLSSRHVELRGFWNRIDVVEGNNAAYLGQSLLPGRGLTDVLDGEAQLVEQLETGHAIDHDIHVGATYRLKAVEWTYLARSEAEHHGGLFVHDEIKLGPKLAVVGDYRADYVPYLNRIVQSPRGSVLFHPSKRSTLRALVGSAFRTPTFLESYLGVPVQLPVAGGALVSEGIRSDERSFRLQPEQVLTTEVGYLNSASDFLTVDGAVFYDRANNLIELAPNRAVTVGDLVNSPQATNASPSTGLYPLFLGGFENQCQTYDVYGMEIGVRSYPLEGLDVYGNYTLMAVKQNDDRCRPEQLALLANDARTSAHKVNAGVQVRSRAGLDGSLDFHYTSPQSWAEQVDDIQKQRIEYQSFHLDAYTLVNARIAYRLLHNQAEISGVAFNLLDDHHREHPFGQVVGRRFMAFFSLRF